MSDELQELLLTATRQSTLREAIAYIAEGLFLDPNFEPPQLLRAACALVIPGDSTGVAAMRRLAREAAQSNLNTAAVLLAPDRITPPSVYRNALNTLATKTLSGSLGEGLTYAQVLAAQREDEHVVATLAAVVGLSWNELLQRSGLSSPKSPTGPWTPKTMQLAFETIDDIVCDHIHIRVVDGIASRPIELLGDPKVTEPGKSGWKEIEQLRTQGVPYEVLLAQRTEGGSWRTHRDRTGGKYSHVLADEFCSLLDAADISHLRASNCGGTTSRTRINQLVGGGGDQVAVIIQDRAGRPVEVVAISVANDGGTASKSGARLSKLPGRVNVPVSALVAGLGWAVRNETADLAEAVGGRLYSEMYMTNLVDALVR